MDIHTLIFVVVSSMRGSVPHRTGSMLTAPTRRKE